MYSEKYLINCSDVDQYRDLKPSAYFTLFQNLAINSTEAINLGHDFLDSHFITWVITRIHLKVFKTPRYQKTIKLVTYPGENKRIIYPRYFMILDENDQVLAKLSSTWALISNKDHKITSLTNEEFNLDTDHLDDELELPKRINANGELNYLFSRVVRFSDCDLNHHLNNTKYIDFIFDIFDNEFYKNHQLEDIQINYLSEIKEKEKVDLYQSKENPYLIVGQVEERVCFIAEIKFRER